MRVALLARAAPTAPRLCTRSRCVSAIFLCARALLSVRGDVAAFVHEQVQLSSRCKLPLHLPDCPAPRHPGQQHRTHARRRVGAAAAAGPPPPGGLARVSFFFSPPLLQRAWRATHGTLSQRQSTPILSAPSTFTVRRQLSHPRAGGCDEHPDGGRSFAALCSLLTLPPPPWAICTLPP